MVRQRFLVPPCAGSNPATPSFVMMQEENPMFKFFTGRAHPCLARDVAESLGVQLGKMKIETFPDGETFVQVQENVRGKDVFILQPIVHRPSALLMELLIIIDALRRASANKICAVIPYYGYSRQDRKDRSRVPITAKLVANLLEKAGVDRVLTMDLHAGQIQGFFDVPVDNLCGRPALAACVKKYLTAEAVCIAPDVGSAKLVKEFADELGVSFGVIGKRRLDAQNVEVTSLIGDVKNKDVILVDDICSTGGTLVSAAKACIDAGCNKVFAAVTHGVLVPGAWSRLESSQIKKVFISDTVPLQDALSSMKLEQVTVAGVLAEAIQRIVSDQSVSSMFASQPANV